MVSFETLLFPDISILLKTSANNKDLLKNTHGYSNLKYFNFSKEYDTYNINNYEEIYKLNIVSLLVRNNYEYCNKEIFIIGGEQIYYMFFNLLNNKYN